MIFRMFGGRELIIVVEDFVLDDRVLIFFFINLCECSMIERLFSVFVRLLLVFCWMINMVWKKFSLVRGMCLYMWLRFFFSEIFMVMLL